MQLVKIFQKFRAFFEVEFAAAVDEILRERRIAHEPSLRLVQIAQRGKIFADILFGDGVRRSAHEPLYDGARFGVALPVALFGDLAQFFEIHVDIDNGLEMLGIVGKAGVVEPRRVVEHAELFFLHAREIFIVNARQQPLGDLAQQTQFALGKRRNALAVKFEKERQKVFEMADFRNDDLARTEHAVAQFLREFVEVDVFERRTVHAAAFLGGSRRENGILAF